MLIGINHYNERYFARKIEQLAYILKDIHVLDLLFCHIEVATINAYFYTHCKND